MEAETTTAGGTSASDRTPYLSSTEIEERSRARASTRTYLACAATVAVCLAAASALTDAADWDPLWVVGLLLAQAIVAESRAIRIGVLRFSATNFVLTLAVVLTGPLPAVLIGALAFLVDAVLRRLDMERVALNYAGIFGSVIGAAGVYAVAQGLGLTEPGTAALVCVVLVVHLAEDGLNFLLVAATSPSLGREVTLGQRARKMLLPVLPWALTAAVLAAGIVHAFHTLGPGVLVAVLVMQAGIQLLLTGVERAERQEQEVRDLTARMREAHRRERYRVAAELHDDALQTLLAARQDVASAMTGRPELLPVAEARLARAVDQIRGLLAERVRELSDGPPDIESVLERILRPAREAGIQTSLAVDPQLEVGDVPAVAALANELVTNALRHAGATTLRLRVAREGDEVIVAVADDGCGFDPDSLARQIRSGHVGLQLLRRRLEDHMGRLSVASAPGKGTEVTARCGSLVALGRRSGAGA